MDMNYDEFNDKWLTTVCYTIAFAISAVVIIAFLASCKTVYVPVETTHTDTLIVNKWQHDSIWVEIMRHDSVIVKEKGDSVIVHHWHTEWRDRWRDREVHDTTYINRTDSVAVPYPVEKKVPFWEKVKIGSVGFIGGGLVIGVIGVILWIRRRYKRN